MIWRRINYSFGTAIILYPPSTKWFSPVTPEDKSESQYKADLLTSIKLGFLFKGEFFSECLNTCLAPDIAEPAKVRIGPDDKLLILIFFFPKSTAK